MRVKLCLFVGAVDVCMYVSVCNRLYIVYTRSLRHKTEGGDGGFHAVDSQRKPYRILYMDFASAHCTASAKTHMLHFLQSTSIPYHFHLICQSICVQYMLSFLCDFLRTSVLRSVPMREGFLSIFRDFDQ